MNRQNSVYKDARFDLVKARGEQTGQILARRQDTEQVSRATGVAVEQGEHGRPPRRNALESRVLAIRLRLQRMLVLSSLLAGLSWALDIVLYDNLRGHFVSPILDAIVAVFRVGAVLQGALAVLAFGWSLIATNRDVVDDIAWHDVTAALRLLAHTALFFPLVLGVVDIASRLGAT